MKELSIEEKAKRYDEAIKIAKEINNEQCAQPFNVMTRVFPELKESENVMMIASMTRLVKAFHDCNFPTPEGFERKDILNWLEKQSENVINGNEKEISNFAWSEDDEKNINDISWYLNSLFDDTKISFDRLNGLEYWLKSLKERYAWNPSDEQMNALHYVTNFDYGGHKATLVLLYEQLKKLREE